MVTHQMTNPRIYMLRKQVSVINSAGAVGTSSVQTAQSAELRGGRLSGNIRTKDAATDNVGYVGSISLSGLVTTSTTVVCALEMLY